MLAVVPGVQERHGERNGPGPPNSAGSMASPANRTAYHPERNRAQSATANKVGTREQMRVVREGFMFFNFRFGLIGRSSTWRSGAGRSRPSSRSGDGVPKGVVGVLGDEAAELVPVADDVAVVVVAGEVEVAVDGYGDQTADAANLQARLRLRLKGALRRDRRGFGRRRSA